jgi:hypothetical protein
MYELFIREREASYRVHTYFKKEHAYIFTPSQHFLYIIIISHLCNVADYRFNSDQQCP